MSSSSREAWTLSNRHYAPAWQYTSTLAAQDQDVASVVYLVRPATQCGGKQTAGTGAW